VAKKDRVPTPPKRPVQAPKAYKPEHDPRRTRIIFIVLAAVIILAAAAVGIGFIMSSGGGGGDDSGAIGDSGTCQLQTFPALEASHVPELPDDYEYNSIPATSGFHNDQTAIWNLYDQPVPQINYVHNLEHGGMVIQYGSEVSDADVASLADWYQQDTRGLVVAPLSEEMEEEDPTLADKIVANAWTHMMKCTTFDASALDQFSDDYRGPQGDGPEKFELDQLQQGGG
jgi:Protein of unknown function (DUF3105)